MEIWEPATDQWSKQANIWLSIPYGIRKSGFLQAPHDRGYWLRTYRGDNEIAQSCKMINEQDIQIRRRLILSDKYSALCGLIWHLVYTVLIQGRKCGCSFLDTLMASGGNASIGIPLSLWTTRLVNGEPRRSWVVISRLSHTVKICARLDSYSCI